MNGRCALVVVVLVCSACQTTPIGVVVQRTPNQPAVRGPVANLGALAFDQSTGLMTLLDPSGGGTWTWDGVHDWQQRATAGPATGTAKLATAPFGMAWDEHTRSLIAEVGDFPGFIRGPQPLPYTWSWKAPIWTRLEGTRTPPIAGGAVAAFPPAHELIMFGGCCSEIANRLVAVPGMWAWDGSTWDVLHPAHMPPARWAQSMFYDPMTEKLIMYGGAPKEPDTAELSDLWAWDGSDWSLLKSPPIQFGYGSGTLVYSPDGRFLLILGSDLWVFDGATWRQLQDSAPQCAPCAFGYDPIRRVTVMVTSSGTSDLPDNVWAWNGTAWTERS